MKRTAPAAERGISFERLGPERAAELARLARELRAREASSSPAVLRGELERAEQAGANLAFALCERGRLRGYLLAARRPESLRGEPGPIVQLTDLALHPSQRALLAEFLARACDEWARRAPGLPLEASATAAALVPWTRAERAALCADLGYRLAAHEPLEPTPAGAPRAWLRWEPAPPNADPCALPVLASHAIGAQRIDVRAVRSELHWARLQLHWNALLERTPGAAGYHSFEFQRAWWRVFGAARRLWILGFWQGSELLGIAPLCSRVRRAGPTRVRELGFIGSPFPVDGPRFLFGEHETACLQVLLQVLAAPDAPWDALELREQRPGAASSAALRRGAAQHGWLVRTAPDAASAHIPLQGGFADFMAARSGHFRRTLRASWRRLEALGRVRCERHSELPALREALERYRALEQRSWKRDAALAVSRSGRSELYDELVASLGPKGQLGIAFLWVDERPAAGAIGLAHGRFYHGLETVYDEDFARCSPGLLLQSLEIEHAFALGCREFDLRAGDLGYKRNWTREVRQSERLCLTRPTLPLRWEHLQHSRLRPWLRRSLARTGLLEPALRAHARWLARPAS